MRARPSSAVGSVLLSAQCDWPASRFMTCRSAGHPAECCAMSVGPDPADALTRGAMARESPGAPQHPDLRMHPTTQSRSPKSGQLPANRTIDHRPRRCQSAADATRRGKRRTANLAIRPHAEKMDTRLRHGWAWRGHLDPHLLCERCIPLSSHSMWMRATSPVRTRLAARAARQQPRPPIQRVSIKVRGGLPA